MNCIESFLQNAREKAAQPALWMRSKGVATFGQIAAIAAGVQEQAVGCKVGDYVLIFSLPSAKLYGAVIGLLGLGCIPIFIEPWLSLGEIEEIIAKTQPKIFFTNGLGRLWALRVKAIRKIPRWISIGSISEGSAMRVEKVPEEHLGLLAFTTGTSGGKSKGVVRTHGGLIKQCEMLKRHFSHDDSPDLCVFPNFVLFNLSIGRCSLFVKKVEAVPDRLQPSSLTCGPTFLNKVFEKARLFPNLQNFHIGGALTDCATFERGFELFPDARWLQVYGSSEAEPVAIVNARDVVKRCQERNFFQTVFLGEPIEEIAWQREEDRLWVSGSHVSPFYFGKHEANQEHKRRDSEGKLWHDMGDRIHVDDEGFWYMGRSNVALEDFLLEQKVSHFLQDSALFIHKGILLGESVEKKRAILLQEFPDLRQVVQCKIHRDRRHGARINRRKTVNESLDKIYQ